MLEAANLLAIVWRGREKLCFLNPVPLQEIYERWIAKFEKPRLKALDKLKRRLERPVSSKGEVYDAGEIVEADPPRRLVIRWRNEWNPEFKAEGWSLCTMTLEPSESAVKLSITHTMEREASKFIEAVSGGWPKVLSNLKSFLENGSPALAEPYPDREARDASQP